MMAAAASNSRPAALVSVDGAVRAPGKYPLEQGMRVAVQGREQLRYAVTLRGIAGISLGGEFGAQLRQIVGRPGRQGNLDTVVAP